MLCYLQVTDERLLRTYEGLLTSEEHAHMLDGSSPAVRKERLLARVLVRTTLSRFYNHAHASPASWPSDLILAVDTL